MVFVRHQPTGTSFGRFLTALHLSNYRVLLALGLAVLAACSSGASLGDAGAEASGAEQELLAVVDDVREVNRMFETAADLKVGDCMREHGLEYSPIIVPDADGNLPEEIVVESRSHPNEIYYDSLSETQRFAFGETLLGPEDQNTTITLENGNSVTILTGGCLGDARARTGAPDDFFRIGEFLLEFEGYPFEVSDIVEGSSDFSTLQSEFDRCMDRSGFEASISVFGYSNEEIDGAAQSAFDVCSSELDVGRSLENLRDAAAAEVLADIEPSLEAWHNESSPMRERLLEELTRPSI